MKNIRVRQMVSSKGNSIANQFIITTASKQIFQSYDSIIVVKHDNGVVELGEDWNYSRTTSKYRNMFLGENTQDTQAKLNSGEYTMLGEL
jgi:hypothetical protein